MMTYKIIYHQKDDLGHDYFNELLIYVKNRKQLNHKIRRIEWRLKFFDAYIIDIKLI